MSQNRTVRVGIVGAGSVARRIHLPGLALCPEVEVAAVCDKDAEAAKACEAGSVETDYKEILARDDLDAVIVATPNYLHYEVVMEALRARKHVLCEKPLALNTKQAQEMYQAAEEAGVVHMTAFTYQFVPAIQYAKHLVERGDLGEIRSVRAAYLMALSSHLLGWRSSKRLAGSGVLADIGSHLIHLAQYLAGDLAALTAARRTFRDDPNSDVEDWVSFLAEFSSGACGTFEISRVCPGRGADVTENMFLELYGSQGAIVFSLQDPLGLQVLLGEDARETAKLLQRVEIPQRFRKLAGSPREAEHGDPRWTYRYDQAFQFVTRIRTGKVERPTFLDGLQCQRVLDAVLASVATKHWVRIH